VAFVVIQLTALQNQKFATLQQNTMQPPGDPDANADSASCK
jgi:hypothetical protein